MGGAVVDTAYACNGDRLAVREDTRIDEFRTTPLVELCWGSVATRVSLVSVRHWPPSLLGVKWIFCPFFPVDGDWLAVFIVGHFSFSFRFFFSNSDPSNSL